MFLVENSSVIMVRKQLWYELCVEWNAGLSKHGTPRSTSQCNVVDNELLPLLLLITAPQEYHFLRV